MNLLLLLFFNKIKNLIFFFTLLRIKSINLNINNNKIIFICVQVKKIEKKEEIFLYNNLFIINFYSLCMRLNKPHLHKYVVYTFKISVILHYVQPFKVFFLYSFQ